VDALIENYRSRAVELGVDQLLEADVYALIESYRSLSIHDATHAKGPRDVPVEALRDPEIADGLCSLVADDFARYLCERLQGEDINVHPEVQDDEEPPYGKAWGYDDRTREPGWGSHTLVVIERGLEMMTVDWTASQFGYADFPLVQRLVVGEDENWQRLSAS
jgi:hypothetical protein